METCKWCHAEIAEKVRGRKFVQDINIYLCGSSFTIETGEWFQAKCSGDCKDRQIAHLQALIGEVEGIVEAVARCGLRWLDAPHEMLCSPAYERITYSEKMQQQAAALLPELRKAKGGGIRCQELTRVGINRRKRNFALVAKSWQENSKPPRSAKRWRWSC